ncbi:hypothetical protein GGR21_003300 [Dysgonomonas hofstadii]|uniref:Type IV secretion system putative lipoprotein virB7 n=1 Tax=Dysgonomonas hofstadii TaxID=637886 RepID=A0A840CZH5_9BACT|nr:membrane lipoprotein lipid attachment site-containing protein [Dysgonomonas hofstadii]MBB4037383.1 hypothetical protein [Dysgonomonas hofstadii]
MKKYILIFSILAILTACDKDPVEFVYSLHCIVVDQDGNDLLNPDTQGAIEISKIEIYYLKNGEFSKYYDRNLDSPKGYRVSKHELDDDHEYKCTFFLSPYEEYKGKKTLTIVKWNENESDTIVSEIHKDGGLAITTNFELNGSSDIEWIASRTFKLVKKR